MKRQLEYIAYRNVIAPLIGRGGYQTQNTKQLDEIFDVNFVIKPDWALGKVQYENIVTAMLVEARKQGRFIAISSEIPNLLIIS